MTGVAERVETKSALSVCYYYALTQRSKYFAIKKNFECYSSPSFGEHHTSDQCRYGRGNDNDVDVYEIKEAIGAIGAYFFIFLLIISNSYFSIYPILKFRTFFLPAKALTIQNLSGEPKD